MTSARPQFTVTPIGVVHRPGMPDDARNEPGTYFDPFAESILEIFPEWEAGLARIEEFSHLVVVLFMDRATPLAPGDMLARPLEDRGDLPPSDSSRRGARVGRTRSASAIRNWCIGMA